MMKKFNINDVLRNRIDEVTNEVAKDENFKVAVAQKRECVEKILEGMSEEKKRMFNYELEPLCNQVENIEMEFMYLQGFKDCMEMLIGMNKD